MKRRIYYVLALAILTFASCNQNDLKLFNDIARIQFSSPIAVYTTAYRTMDTTKTYTFFYSAETIKQDTVFFDIYTSGNISEKDRPFSLQQVQVNGTANAIPGTDYKAFTDPTIKSAYIIKAGQAHATVPIVLLRSISQKTTILTLKITITANENFQVGEESCLWRKVIFTDSVNKPASWRDNLYGIYSITKHSFMIQSTGQKWDETFCLNLPYIQSSLYYYMGTLKKALASYNNSHPNNPLTDENNLLVQFP